MIKNMKNHINPNYKNITFSCCAMTAILAIMALAGWLSGNLFLSALGNEHIPMAPSTAICFLLLSAALSLSASRYSHNRGYLIIAASLTSALFCIIIALQFAGALHLDIESIFFQQITYKRGFPIGRMSPLTTTTMFFTAMAIFFQTVFPMNRRINTYLSGLTGLVIGFLGFVLVLGYLYENPFFYQSSIIPVAVTTSMAFMFTGTAIVAVSGTQSVPLKFFAGDATGAKIVRSFLPILFLSFMINGAADVVIFNTIGTTGLAIAFSTVVFFIIICVILIVISSNTGRMLEKSMDAQRESEERFRDAFESSAIGMAIVSIEWNWLEVNESLCQIVGYQREELLRMNVRKITHSDDIDTDRAQITSLLSGKIPYYHIEKKYIRKDGHAICILLSVSLVHNAHGSPLYFITQIEDITQRKEAEAFLHTLSTRDSLTGLYNRRAFDDFLDAEWKRAQRNGYQISILMLDVDFFKKYNDTYGHVSGDECLQKISNILKQLTRRPGDMAARFGGEEFVIIFSMIDSEKTIRFADRIRTDIEALQIPHENSEANNHVTVSIGVVTEIPRGTLPAKELINFADKALYQAKHEGRNRVVCFDAVAGCFIRCMQK